MTSTFFRLTIALALGAATCFSAVAQQKYGHLNSGNILVLMPETQKANKQLETFQRQLIARGETMSRMLQDKYDRYTQKAKNLSAAARTEKENEFRQDQGIISRYAEAAKERLEMQRRELLAPIIKDLEKTVREVAKENGYHFVFDISGGSFLFASESQDIAPLIKKKLKLQ